MQIFTFALIRFRKPSQFLRLILKSATIKELRIGRLLQRLNKRLKSLFLKTFNQAMCLLYLQNMQNHDAKDQTDGKQLRASINTQADSESSSKFKSRVQELYQDQKTVGHFTCEYSTFPAVKDYQQRSFTLNFTQPYFKDFTQSNPIQFKQFSQYVKQNDFSSLKGIWCQSFKNKLNFILDNWNIFQQTHQESVKPLISAFVDNIQLFDHQNNSYDQNRTYDYHYPGIIKIINKMKKIVGFEGEKFKKRAGVWSASPQQIQNFERIQKKNEIFKHCIKQHESKKNNNGPCTISLKPTDPQSQKQQNESSQKQPRNNPSQKILLGQYIPRQNVFDWNTDNWKDILFQAAAAKRYNLENVINVNCRQTIESVYQFSELLLNNNQLTQPYNRLCCSKFYYLGFPLTPINNQNLLIRKKLFEIAPKNRSKDTKKKSDRKTCEFEVKDIAQMDNIIVDICCLLNSGGGVLLFNCKDEYLETCAIGEIYIQEMKKVYRFLIKEATKKIYPKVNIDRQIRISFVPVVKNPYEGKFIKKTLEQDDRRNNRMYLPGLYVLRVAVQPTCRQRLYCYEIAKETFISGTLEQGQRKILRGSDLVSQMARKFQFYYDGQEEDQQQRLLIGRQTNYVALHQCVDPYEGKPKFSEQQKQADQTKTGHFKHVNLIVASSMHLKKIEKKLKARGIDCWINTQFQKHKQLKTAFNTAPIHHNQPFDKLLNAISYKQQFHFNGKNTYLIRVTQCIKLSNARKDIPLPLFKYDKIKNWLKHQFPESVLEYWIFDKSEMEEEHYLRSNHPLHNIFLYYILCSEAEPSLLKNPPPPTENLPKTVYIQETNKKMRQIYNQHSKAKNFL